MVIDWHSNFLFQFFRCLGFGNFWHNSWWRAWCSCWAWWWFGWSLWFWRDRRASSQIQTGYQCKLCNFYLFSGLFIRLLVMVSVSYEECQGLSYLFEKSANKKFKVKSKAVFGWKKEINHFWRQELSGIPLQWLVTWREVLKERAKHTLYVTNIYTACS